jgi:hypothetical protein
MSIPIGPQQGVTPKQVGGEPISSDTGVEEDKATRSERGGIRLYPDSQGPRAYVPEPEACGVSAVAAVAGYCARLILLQTIPIPGIEWDVSSPPSPLLQD